MSTRTRSSPEPDRLVKVPTGIAGFDDITHGGLPAGRPTLICGAAGCGKSLFATEFLVRGAREFGEPGVLLTFEESVRDIRKNVSSLGFDIGRLIARQQLVVDYVHVDRSQIEENGAYDLEALFIRLDHAVKRVKARRVVLDTLEALFVGLQNEALLRNELRRLFAWLRDRGLTTVITAERGAGALTRHGLEEYVSDCVILLDHRVQGQVSTRRLRIVKYRGSLHGTNEYPFLIDAHGIAVMPLTSSGMDYKVSNQRISTGVPELDAMLGGKGLFRGSTVMLSGTSGTGKSSFAACMANAACERGERCLFFSFEESPDQILRNMKSIGLDLARHVKAGLLRFETNRPTVYGLEMHLVRMHQLVDEFDPQLVIVDPISNLASAGSLEDSTNMLIRSIDYLRKRGITAFFVSLNKGGSAFESTDEGMSSLVDTWMLARDIEHAGERTRALYVLKSRGMAHSNQIREFVITRQGLKLIPAYLGPSGTVLTGSARLVAEAHDARERTSVDEESRRQRLAFEHRRQAVEAQIAALRASFEAETQEFERGLLSRQQRAHRLDQDRQAMARSRHAAPPIRS